MKHYLNTAKFSGAHHSHDRRRLHTPGAQKRGSAWWPRPQESGSKLGGQTTAATGIVEPGAAALQ